MLGICPYCGIPVSVHSGGATTIQYVCSSCWCRVVLPRMQAMRYHERRSGGCEAAVAPEVLGDE